LWTPTVYDPARIPKSGVTSTIPMGRIKDGLSMLFAGVRAVLLIACENLADVDREVPVYDVMPYGQRLERALARPNCYGMRPADPLRSQ
jgi:hypothetical protein